MNNVMENSYDDNHLNSVMKLWKRHEISSNDLIMFINPMLKRLAVWSSEKYGIPWLAEDIQQELGLALMGEAGASWKENRPLSSYMAGWAWRIASSMAKTAKRETSFDTFFDASEADFQQGEGNRAEAEWALAHDDTPESLLLQDGIESLKQQALSRISIDDLDRALARFGHGKSDQNGSIQQNSNRRIQTRPVKNERLFAIRTSIGMTRQVMAESLGLALSQYAAYESGKNRSVPEWVYQQAEALYKNASRRVQLWNEIADLPMSKIVSLWCDMLSIEDPMEIAKYINVSSRTLRRWMEDQYKPKSSIIISHHARVHEIAEKGKQDD